MITDVIAGSVVTGLDGVPCEGNYKYGGAIGTALDGVQLVGGAQTVVLSTGLTIGIYGFGAAASSQTAVAVLPGALAALGGYEIGSGINSLYERYSGTSVGSQLYDVFN